MVTYFNRKDMVSFGNYLLSEKRRKLYQSHPESDKMPTIEERLSMVSHPDLENWLDDGNRIEGEGFYAKHFTRNGEEMAIDNLSKDVFDK